MRFVPRHLANVKFTAMFTNVKVFPQNTVYTCKTDLSFMLSIKNPLNAIYKKIESHW